MADIVSIDTEYCLTIVRTARRETKLCGHRMPCPEHGDDAA